MEESPEETGTLITPTQFLLRFAIYAILLVVGIAAINVVVDPYLVFNSPRVDGLNAFKPAVETHEKLMKGYDAIRRPAKTLILGSSRSDIGLDPSSESFRAEDQPVYNLSVLGGNPEIAIQHLQHFIASRPAEELPRTLLIGLDFENFIHIPRTSDSAPERPPEPAIPSLLVLPDGSENPDRWWQVMKDYAVSTFSLDALMDSVATIVSSYRRTGVSLDERGRTDEGTFQTAVLLNGVGGLFAQKNRDTIRKYGQPHWVLDDYEDGTTPDLVNTKRLVDLGQSINAHVILFIHPAHADWMELFDRLGYWEDFERWKRDLVALMETERAAGAQVELWDFAGFESYIQELVPAQNAQAAPLQWFWEPTHYTSALGEILIARMMTGGPPEDFGTPLTAENLDERLQQVRADRERYRRENPAELERVSSLLCGRVLCDP